MLSYKSKNVFAAIPVKAGAESKSRLSGLLEPQERMWLTLAMFKDVVEAVNKSQAFSKVFVVSSDPKIIRSAEELGAYTFHERERGLNMAVEQVTRCCMEKGANSVLTLPSDIPLLTVEDIIRLLELGSERRSIVVSPSRDGGTNALLRTPPDAIHPCFGQNSFIKHLKAAEARGVDARVYRSPSISLDIDSKEDLKHLLFESRETQTHKLLRELNISDRLN